MSNTVVFDKKNYHIIPQRLREARESLEFTMEHLGNLVGVKRQTISNYESGLRSPEPEILMNLIRALKQPLIFFTTERPTSLGLKETIFFRSFQSKTARTNRKCEIYSDWFVQIAAYFEKFINFPTVDLPETSSPINGKHYTIEEIEEIAQICRKHWKLGNGPISNIVALLESKGIIVSRIKLDTNTVSAYSFREADRPFIFLGSEFGLFRSRFSAAHELGHLILHRGISKEEFETDLKHFEKEADYFASAFLLPRETYPLEIFSFKLSAFIELKKRWKTSVASQIMRCKHLGIINEDREVGLRKQLSKNKWLKNEPLDNQFPIEKSAIMEKSLNLLVKEGMLTAEELINNIRLSLDTISILINTDFKFNLPETNPKVYLRLISK